MREAMREATQFHRFTFGDLGISWGFLVVGVGFLCWCFAFRVFEIFLVVLRSRTTV